MRLFVCGKFAVLTGVNKMAKSIKADAMAQAVKTLSQVKRETAKPSKAVITLSIDEQVKLATKAGEAKGTELNAREVFNQAAKALREAKATVGDARKCPLAKAFLAARFPDTVAASTKANALSAFRAAVESGKAYDENAKRKEKKKAAKTGAKTPVAKTETETESDESETESEETAKSFSVSIARKGSAKKAAQVLRDLMNKMRDSEEYAPLAALIIDSLDEFDGSE
jgi:hypothetical protein